MKKTVLTICILFFLCFNSFGQQNIGHLEIIGNVSDSLASYDVNKGFPIKIYIISNDNIIIFDSYDGRILLPLMYGVDYKIIFSKIGYKSKMILAEVKGSKKPDEFNYQIPVHIELVPGEDNTVLKPIGKIFYNSKEDYYDSVNY